MKEVESTIRVVTQAINKGANYLFFEQRSNGSWCDSVSSSAMATGGCLLALYFDDREHFATQLHEGAQWLCQTQHADGSWGDAVVDAGNLNATSFAVAALKLINTERFGEAIDRGMGFIELQGGLDAVADMSRCSMNVLCLVVLSLAGLCEWKRVPRIPLGIALLPYSLRRKVSFTLPVVLALALWHARSPGGFLRHFVNRLAQPRALAYLRSLQVEDGGMEESPLLVAFVVNFLIHAQVGHDIVRRGISYILSCRRQNGSWSCERDLEFSVTTMVLMGLNTAGFSRDPRLQATKEWILNAQFTSPFPQTGSPAGGWGWGQPSGWPNTDDTSNALTSLVSIGMPVSDPHVQKGQQWLKTMQNRDGSWGCFVRNGFVRNKILSLDEPCPGFTAHAIIGFHMGTGCTHAHPVVRRALQYCERVQRSDGSIHCLWYHNFVSGTAFVLEAYCVLGLHDHLVAIKCRQWLMVNQNDDGSWGGAHGQVGTVEETCWALIALLKSGLLVTDEQVEKAVSWIAAAQQANGSWLPSVVGVYFNSYYYSSDHIANGFAMRALGHYIQEKRHTCGSNEN